MTNDLSNSLDEESLDDFPGKLTTTDKALEATTSENGITVEQSEEMENDINLINGGEINEEVKDIEGFSSLSAVMNGKLKVATDDSHLDPTNCNGNFKQKLNENKPRVDEVLYSGIELKKGGHIQSERIPSKLNGINDLLQDLIKAAEKKEMQQTFGVC